MTTTTTTTTTIHVHVAAAVASHIDLNTLDALARVSRGLHDGLIQYRGGLLGATLRCSNEASPVNRDELLRHRARASNWHYVDHGRSFNGKSGNCAHDMVQECRRCGEVNCAIKLPPRRLRERHRRLCLACARAPLALLTRPTLLPDTPLDAEAVQRAVCTCDSKAVWLCQPCGRGIRSADHEYQRIWRWRNHYGEMLGGLGTGIGDGDRGVVCGREQDCLAARDREQEVDCDAIDARDAPRSPDRSDPASLPSPHPDDHDHASSLSPSPSPSSFSSSSQLGGGGGGPGYRRHEIEGIGGRVKCKLVRTVRVGACVPEWDDEKIGAAADGRILVPEVKAAARSWCGWCWRVVPGSKDLAAGDAEAEPGGGLSAS
ncbi:hypothetical protein L249_1977 [Ophiocordyceps polyrhachis-furcata BCC 54312]|uniref:Uncharacterized protein n=1 Tax=Ophiocordyceps polyrhachis-furcata BCC 54312 TaxID=1330021 RepID=A0A367LNP0_9HYPO|nr:hypothetical protein L249_1977 [Ophiocordyceps polyrhachis-furcata BCC 54312]